MSTDYFGQPTAFEREAITNVLVKSAGIKNPTEEQILEMLPIQREAVYRNQIEDFREFLNATPTPAASSGNTASLKARLAELKQFAAEQSAPKPDIAAYLERPDLEAAFNKWDNKDRHGDVWTNALHETGHCGVAMAVGVKVRGAIIRSDASGEALPIFDNTPPLTRACVSIAGNLAGYMLGTAPNTAMANFVTDAGLETDAIHFAREISEAAGQPVAEDSAIALSARARAEFLIRDNACGIVAMAKVLYDNVDTEIDGNALRFIFDYHAGLHDERLNDMATAAVMRGEVWSFNRGRSAF